MPAALPFLSNTPRRSTAAAPSYTATRLLVYTQPQSAITGVAFGTQPVVRAVDLNGNLDTSFTGNVTLALYAGTGSLSGTATVAAVAGVATFTNLVITGTGRKVLQATGGGLTAGSSGGMVVMPAATAAQTYLKYGVNTTDKTDCGSAASVDNVSAGDMSVFLRLIPETIGSNQYFISKYNSGATGYAMSVDSSLSSGRISLNFGRSGTDALVTTDASNVVTANNPFDVGFSWQDSDATRELRIYLAAVGTALNEVSGYDGGSNQGTGTADADAGANLLIGNLQLTGVNPFVGKIGWAAKFNKVLTAQQRLTLQQGFDRNSAAQILAIGGCVMLHRLNATGTSTDLTGNANNGTTTGATTTTGETVFSPSAFGCSNDPVDMTNYYYTNSHAEVSYTTTATSVTLGIARTIEATYDAQAAIAVFENGVYKGQILAATIGLNYGTLTGLTAGSKTITLRNGVRSNPAAGANEGTFMASVRFNNTATELAPTTYAADRTIVTFQDSLGDGFVSDPVGLDGVHSIFRSRERAKGYDTIFEGGGGWQVYDYASDATARTNSALLLGLYSAEICMLELGINDSGRADWTSSAFGTGYAAWLVALNAENPRTAIKAVTLPRHGGGETGFAAWRTEIINAASGKAYVQVTNGNPGYWDGSNPGVDGIHPGPVSSPAIATNMETICGI